MININKVKVEVSPVSDLKKANPWSENEPDSSAPIPQTTRHPNFANSGYSYSLNPSDAGGFHDKTA